MSAYSPGTNIFENIPQEVGCPEDFFVFRQSSRLYGGSTRALERLKTWRECGSMPETHANTHRRGNGQKKHMQPLQERFETSAAPQEVFQRRQHAGILSTRGGVQLS